MTNIKDGRKTKNRKQSLLIITLYHKTRVSYPVHSDLRKEQLH